MNLLRLCALLSGMIVVGGTLESRLVAGESPERMWVFVGTYTRGESEGIYVLQLDMESGALIRKSSVRSDNPSFVAIHPNQKWLYAVNEVGNFNSQKAGAISAFSFSPESGELTLLNQDSSVGPGPCHLTVDASGQYVLAANYGGGSVCVLPIDNAGRLGRASSFVQHTGSSVNQRRQSAPHAHSINLDVSNRFAVAADLGIDKLLIYDFNPRHGTLTDTPQAFVQVAPGAGPRHFAFHPSGKFAYVINELHLTVTAFRFEQSSGRMTELQTLSTLPPGSGKQGSTAEVQVHPSGRFLYGSNRGHDSIAVYSIDAETGKLTWVENELTGGKTPRNFGIDPTGQFLLAANQSTGDILTFRITSDTGELTVAGQGIQIPSPVCVRMMPVAR